MLQAFEAKSEEEQQEELKRIDKETQHLIGTQEYKDTSDEQKNAVLEMRLEVKRRLAQKELEEYEALKRELFEKLEG